MSRPSLKSIALFLGIAAAAAGFGGQAAAAEPKFPSRPITLVIPWPAGGVPDTELRLLAEIAGAKLGQPIVPENKPGGVGTLGPATVAATAKPDGYTITHIGGGVLRTPFLLKTTYDPRKDFTYIGGIAQYTFGVVVRADSPIKTWADFVDFAKKNPGKLTYTTFGTNSSLNLTMESVATQLGIKLKHIPSRGNAENNAALLGGHVMASADGSAWGPLVDSGDFRLLVTWGAERTKRWPTVPTLKELGIDVVDTAPFGLAGPKGLDPKIAQTIYDAFRAALYDPRHIEFLKKFDMEVFDKGPADYTKWVMTEIDRQEQNVKKFAVKK